MFGRLVPSHPCLAALCGALVCALTTSAAAETIAFQTDQPQPNVGDGVRLETDALQTPPYNAGGYEVWFWFCRDTPENCRRGGRWFRVPVTNNLGDPVQPMQRYVCTSGRCSLRVRLTQPREANYTFVAAVYRGGGRVAQSRPVTISWQKQAPEKPKPPQTLRPSLTLTVDGVSCTAHIGPSGTSRTYGAMTDRCIAETPGGAVVRMARNGSGPGVTATARFTGYAQPQWSIRFTWQSREVVCNENENPCTRQLPGFPAPFFGSPPTQDWNGRAIVSAHLPYDHTKGERGTNPDDGKLLSGLTAEVHVDYRVR